METPRLSVIMPNYNDSAYIGEALDAILGQSVRAFEVVVVDDASTDNSLEILEQYARRDSTVRILRNEKNLGAAGAAKRAVEAARGEYIYTASANDRVHPGFFESAMTLLARYPEAGFCLAEYESIDGQQYRYHLGDQPCYFSVDQISRILSRWGLFPFTSGSTIIRRDAAAEAGGFILELRGMSDSFLLLVLTVRHGLCYLPQSCMSVRRLRHSYGGKLFSWKEQKAVGDHFMTLLESDKYGDVMQWIRKTGVWLGLQPYLILMLMDQPRRWPLLSMKGVKQAIWDTIKTVVAPYAPLSVKRAVARIRDCHRRIYLR